MMIARLMLYGALFTWMVTHPSESMGGSDNLLLMAAAAGLVATASGNRLRNRMKLQSDPGEGMDAAFGN